MDAVEFAGVSFAHVGRPTLIDFTLTVGNGEIVALVGASGAGKTTVLRLVNRLLLPVAGDVLVQGRDTRSWDPIRLRRAIGYVMQDVGLFPHMTVAGNIAVVPRLERWTASRTTARVSELLALIDLPAETFADRYPDELSGGQRQRVGVARALAVDPPILLMDEPFGALDPVTRRQLQLEFLRIQDRLHKSVILVTHDMGEAMTLGDRVGVIDSGRLVWCGPPQQLDMHEDPRVRRLVESALPLNRPARTSRP